jgi:hypothetical protein
MKMAEWVRNGGALPNIPEMVAELTEPTYTFIGGQFAVEEKDQLKLRIGKSPDLADALALTFSMVDMPGQMQAMLAGPQSVRHDVDPYAIHATAADERSNVRHVRTADDEEID